MNAFAAGLRPGLRYGSLELERFPRSSMDLRGRSTPMRKGKGRVKKRGGKGREGRGSTLPFLAKIPEGTCKHTMIPVGTCTIK